MGFAGLYAGVKAMSKQLVQQKRALQEAKPSSKVEGKNAGSGKHGGYHLADGTTSVTELVPVPVGQTGNWHYYSPRKEVVVHGATFEFCAAQLNRQYGVVADPSMARASHKNRFWVIETAGKGKDKGKVWAKGIATIKSWAVKAQFAEVAQAAVAQKVARKPKPLNAVKRLVVDGKPVTPEGAQALKVAEAQAPVYTAQEVQA